MPYSVVILPNTSILTILQEIERLDRARIAVVNYNSEDTGWDRDEDRDRDEGRGEDVEVPYFLLMEFIFFGF
jgi:hypothetical protein